MLEERRPLSILFYVEGLDIGGANQTTVTTAVAMSKRGHAVCFAAQDGPLRERLEAAGIPHFAVDTDVRHPNLAVARRLGGILDRERVEIACANGWDCFADMLLATIPRGIPCVPTFPSIYPEYHHPRVEKAIVFSGEYREALIRDYGWKPESLEMLVSRIDTQRFRPDLDGSELRARWGLAPDSPMVFMGCRQDAMKIEGIRFLLDAVPSMADRCPRARVVLAGDGALAGEVAERAAALNETIGHPYIVLAGRVLEMQKAFAAADVVVGNGARSGMEGLACGRPVASVGPSGFAGIMTPVNIEDFAYYNFDKGRVYDGTTRKDPVALADAVAGLLADPELRKSLGEFGRKFSQERLSVDAGAARLEEILRSQQPLGWMKKLGLAKELAAGVISFGWFSGRRKVRKILLGSAGPSRAVFDSPSKGPGFLRNSATTFLTAVFGLGVGVVQAAVTARILRPEGKGELAAVLILPQLLATLAPLGINWASTYHLGRKTFDREVLIRTVITALILLSATGMLGCLVAGHFLRDSILQGVSRTAFFMAVLTIPTQICLLFLTGIFRGEMRIAEANLMDVCRTVLMFALILGGLVVLKLGVRGVVLGQLLGEGLVAILAFRRLGGIPAVPLLRWDVLRRLMGFGVQIYSFSILLYLNYRFDLFLVRSRLDLVQTGLYATAVSLAEILWLLPNAMGSVLFPSVAQTSGGDRDQLTLAVCRRSFWIMLILCALLAAGRQLALKIFFGASFVAASPALLALLPGILAMSIQLVLGSALSGRGRPLPVTVGAALAFVVNVVLNLLWIPRYGIVGASLASSVSYAVVTLVVIVAYLRITGSRLRDALVLRREDLAKLAGLLGRFREALA